MRRVACVIACVVALASEAGAQKLSLTQELIDGKNGITTIGNMRALALSFPDAAFVYGLASGEPDDALTVFARSPTTGHLTFVEAEVEGVGGVTGLASGRAIAIPFDGAHVYVAGTVIVTFSRDSVTGELTFVGTTPYDRRASAMAFSPGGEHLYISSDLPGGNGAVTVYARDGVT